MPVQPVKRSGVRAHVQASQRRIDPVFVDFTCWKESDCTGPASYAAAGIPLLKGAFDDKSDVGIPMGMLWKNHLNGIQMLAQGEEADGS